MEEKIIELEKRINDLEYKILDIKVNYLYSLFIIIGYFIFNDLGNRNIFGYSFTWEQLYFGYIFIITLVFLKSYIRYTKIFLKNNILGVKK